MVWNAVAAIGGSFISGLFGSKKQKQESTSKSTIDYKGLADAAIAGGFNPLTAIRTGGASGFVTTKTKGTSSGGGPSVGAAIGDAIASAGANNLFGSFNAVKNDPIKLKSKSTGAVSSLVSAQLRGGTRTAPAVNVQPTQRIQRSPVSTTRAPAKVPNKPGDGTLVGGDDPTVSSMGWNNGRYGLFHAPWMPDAEVAETIYGDNEINSTLYSIGKHANDWGYSAWRNYQSGKSDLRTHLKDKIRENNYREMSKRPVVSNRKPLPDGWRYAN